MITTLADAPRTPNLLNVANTAFNILVDADPKIVKVLESLSVTCKDTDTDVTIVLTKDGTDYYLWNAVTVKANTKPQMLTDDYPHHLRMDSSMKIRVKASNANQITVIAMTLNQMPVKLGPAPGGFGTFQNTNPFGSVAGGY